MGVSKQELLKFQRTRWILIVVTALFFSAYFVGFKVFKTPLGHTILLVIYVPWMLYWVARKYRCPRCGTIPQLVTFKAIDLFPKCCQKCGLDLRAEGGQPQKNGDIRADQSSK